MRKLFLLFCILSFSVGCTQTSSSDSNSTFSKNKQHTSETPVYKLYPTENMWNFIKLDTRNGRMWLVQFSFEDDKRFESVLSKKYLVGASKEVAGRFALHPTKNSYNFILLDQIDGQAWQVQWSFEQNERFVIEIN